MANSIFRYDQLNPIIFGPNAIGCVGEELTKLGCKKLMLVCGPNVTKDDLGGKRVV